MKKTLAIVVIVLTLPIIGGALGCFYAAYKVMPLMAQNPGMFAPAGSTLFATWTKETIGQQAPHGENQRKHSHTLALKGISAIPENLHARALEIAAKIHEAGGVRASAGAKVKELAAHLRALRGGHLPTGTVVSIQRGFGPAGQNFHASPQPADRLTISSH